MAKKKTETTEEVAVMEKPFALPQKRVTIKFFSKPRGMVQDPKHMLAGGLGPRARKSFQLPRTQAGNFVDPFPSEEARLAVEKAFGLPAGRLSPDNVENNFFSGYIISLDKMDKHLDLSTPRDYLFYLVAKVMKDYVAPSLRHCTDPNLSNATYMWYIEDEDAVAETKSRQISRRSQAWKEFGKIEDSTSKLRQIMIEHKGLTKLPPVAMGNTTKGHEWLHSNVGDLVENDPEVFINYINDTTLPVKADIHEAVNAGVLISKGNLFFQEDESALALEGELNDINGAVRFLLEPENSDYYATIKQRIQNAQ